MGILIMIAAAVAAAVMDLRTRRIPNWLTGALAVSAIVVRAFGGWREAADAAIVIAAVIAVGTVAFSRGWFGGGDVKLFAACAGFVGSRGIVPFTLDVFVAGSLVVLIDVVRRRSVRRFFTSTAGVVGGMAPTTAIRVPYGTAIAAGALVYALTAHSSLLH